MLTFPLAVIAVKIRPGVRMTRKEGQRILDKYLPRTFWELHPVTVRIVGPILLRFVAMLLRGN